MRRLRIQALAVFQLRCDEGKSPIRQFTPEIEMDSISLRHRAVSRDHGGAKRENTSDVHL